ncbi:hypothetical protein DENSPDRAFT_846068 [Dentipellis sp. KUC8613]|nr:hypothetical protein DENSPDRAFT_846068 [Dentipellis sp. KUC8613]
MQLTIALVSLGVAAVAQAAPFPGRWGKPGNSTAPSNSTSAANGTALTHNVTDTDILNFALTLEHLENAFYTGGLQNFSQDAFDAAGLPPAARGFYEQLSQHEQTHVDNLTTILGDKAVKPCIYNFPVNGNVSNFVAISDLLEVVGASAYSGSAKFLHNKDFLTTAATILATEARQSAWINNAVRGGNPWSTAYETALDLNQVFTLASGNIVSCPSTNLPLPVQANPALTASPADAAPGSNLTLSFTPSPSANGTQLFAAFLSGNTPAFVPLTGSAPFTITIPPTLEGFVFLAITNSTEKTDDSVTVAGPTFLNFPFNSNNTLIQLAH